MKKITLFLAALAATIGIDTYAQTDFTLSESTFPGTHRTSAYAADLDNDGRMDLIYGGQLDPTLDKPGIWNWHTLSTIVWNKGGDTWEPDCLMAEQNAEPEKTDDGTHQVDEEGNPVYHWHLNGPKHGIRLSTFNQYAGIDYNNDGLVDLLVFGQDGSNDDWFMSDEWKKNHLSLYRNNGDGTFTFEENAVFPSSSPDNSGVNFSLAVADYDRDGWVDFAVSGNLDDSEKQDTYPSRLVTIYRNDGGTGVFTRMDIAETRGDVWTSEVKDEAGEVVTEKQKLEGWFYPIAGNVHFADLNNDGWVDLIFDGWADEKWDPEYIDQNNYARVYINQNGEKFVDVTPKNPFYTLRSSSSVVNDFDGDGYLDFFMTGYGDNGYSWNAFLYTNTQGEDVFDVPTEVDDLGLDGTEKVKTYVRDFNGDGIPDITHAVAHNDKKLNVYYGSLTGAFTDKEYEDYPCCRDAWGVVADFDNDGLSDIFQVGYIESADAKLYYNTTPDVVAETPEAPKNVKAEYADGKLEISWDAVEGAAEKHLAYNVYVKNSEGKIYCIVPADPETGFVKVSNERTSALRPAVTTYSITVPEGDYTVGVQTISLIHETASAFTKADGSLDGLFDAKADKKAGFDVTVDAEGIVAEGCGEPVKVIDILGRTVAEGAAGKHIDVPADGVLIIVKDNVAKKIVK